MSLCLRCGRSAAAAGLYPQDLAREMVALALAEARAAHAGTAALGMAEEDEDDMLSGIDALRYVALCVRSRCCCGGARSVLCAYIWRSLSRCAAYLCSALPQDPTHPLPPSLGASAAPGNLPCVCSGMQQRLASTSMRQHQTPCIHPCICIYACTPRCAVPRRTQDG